MTRPEYIREGRNKLFHEKNKKAFRLWASVCRQTSASRRRGSTSESQLVFCIPELFLADPAAQLVPQFFEPTPLSSLPRLCAVAEMR